MGLILKEKYMTDMTEDEEMAMKEEVADLIMNDMETWGEDRFHEVMQKCLPCCLRLDGEMDCLTCPNYPKEKGTEEIDKHVWVAEVCVFTSMAFEGLAENAGENN